MLSDVIFLLIFFTFLLFSFFSSRLAIVPHATWKLLLQAHDGCCELIGRRLSEALRLSLLLALELENI